jgi:hypothetical protein
MLLLKHLLAVVALHRWPLGQVMVVIAGGGAKIRSFLKPEVPSGYLRVAALRYTDKFAEVEPPTSTARLKTWGIALIRSGHLLSPLLNCSVDVDEFLELAGFEEAAPTYMKRCKLASLDEPKQVLRRDAEDLTGFRVVDE